MQLLPSFHILLTCSFVLLLAYVLSRFFTYLAYSAIHGSSTATTSKAETSRVGRFIESSARQGRLSQPTEQNETVAAAMYRLQENDVEVDADPYQAPAELMNMAPRSTPLANYEFGGGIFDDAIDQQYNLTRHEAAWDDGEGLEYATDKYGRYNGEEGSPKAQLVAAAENGASSAADDSKEGKDQERDRGSESVLRDADGSSSLLRRLPPTWSDLEKIVSTTSMKFSVPPSVSPLPIPED